MNSSAEAGRLQFEFADGLRGVAAIAVAIFHAYAFTGRTGDQDELPGVFKLLLLGNYAVPVFIVLSGFVLMLPVTRELVIRRGTWEFFKRRARRILPPYYVSLLLFLLLIWLVPFLQAPMGTAWDSKVPVTWEGVISHVLLLHNLSPDWVYQINGPAWSVATEWQLYFAMPFLLLPLWRKVGSKMTVGAAIAIGVSVHFLLPSLDDAHFWFLGLFAMGMGAARIIALEREIPGERAIFFSIGVLTTIAVAAAYVLPFDLIWLSETAVGAFVASSLVLLARQRMRGTPGFFCRSLESEQMVTLGAWSYSVYLIHSPILALGNLILLPLGLPILVHFALMVCAVLPLAIGVAYVFHRLVERRFMSTHQKRLVTG